MSGSKLKEFSGESANTCVPPLGGLINDSSKKVILGAPVRSVVGAELESGVVLVGVPGQSNDIRQVADGSRYLCAFFDF